MGMAASQARYLGLTARKTNTEYEGQQINQQRTALANQSAGLFSRMLALEVPTPPSTQDFTKVSYTYSDGVNKETITNFTPLENDPNYNYTVTHYHNSQVYTGIETKQVNPQIHGTKTANPTPPPDYLYTFTQVGNSPLTLYNSSNGEQKAAVEQIKTNNPGSVFASAADGDIYTYKLGGVDYFVCKNDLITSFDSIVPNGAFEGQSALNRYNAAYLDTRVETTEKAFLQQDSSGRFISVKLQNSSPTFSLSTNTNTDDLAYGDAMNQYNYNTIRYQKEIEDINAKTKIIQEEDRTLELRLKQLDTEQKALQTEMDAVKKVIDKNIEMTFKTFSS